MDSQSLSLLFDPSSFMHVASVMFSIGAAVLIIHGAWKAYLFVKSAVVGSFTGTHQESVDRMSELYKDYDPNASDDFEWDEESYYSWRDSKGMD